MGNTGLNKDGGISFKRELKFDKKNKKNVPEGMFSRRPEDKRPEPEEKTEEKPRNADKVALARREKLNNKLSTAKKINAGGLAINTSSIIGVLFYVDSLMLDPNTIDTLNQINSIFGLDIDFENGIQFIQNIKVQIIGFCISSQTMVVGYKDIVQKMKDRDNESFYEVFNEELGKIGK